MAATNCLRQLDLRLHPSDRATLAILALAAGLSVARLPVLGSAMTGFVVTQVSMLVGFAAVSFVLARWEQRTWVRWVRPLVTVTVIVSLYPCLGKLGLAAMPYHADAALTRIDVWLLGRDPSLELERWQSPACVEFFGFIYGAFIPYIYLSLFLGCLGRPPLERDQFLTGWVFTYAISYVGYLFVPAHGPAAYHAADYSVSLQGGVFYWLVVHGNGLTGDLFGAFPSLHVGGSVYLCLFDLKTNRFRGLTYLPMVLLIYASTVFLRYHYVIDLVVGTCVPLVSIALGQWVFLQWSRRRVAAGLTALTGGEGDDLPADLKTCTANVPPVLAAI